MCHTICVQRLFPISKKQSDARCASKHVDCACAVGGGSCNGPLLSLSLTLTLRQRTVAPFAVTHRRHPIPPDHPKPTATKAICAPTGVTPYPQITQTKKNYLPLSLPLQFDLLLYCFPKIAQMSYFKNEYYKIGNCKTIL